MSFSSSSEKDTEEVLAWHTSCSSSLPPFPAKDIQVALTNTASEPNPPEKSQSSVPRLRRRTAGIAAGHALKRPRHATPNNSDNNNNSNSDTDDGPSHASSKGSLESPPYIPSPRPPQPPPPHELFLPWLPDRFYVNAIAAESDPIEKESKRAEEDEKLDEGSTGERSMAARCCRVKVGAMEGEAGDVGAMGRNGRVEGGDEGKDKGGGRWQQQRQRQCEVRRTFSLAKLVEVVSGGGGGGEDWPGIKAAVFGTFSMDMRRLTEEIPSLFSMNNRSVAVLVLHGDNSLERTKHQPRLEPKNLLQQPNPLPLLPPATDHDLTFPGDVDATGTRAENRNVDWRGRVLHDARAACPTMKDVVHLPLSLAECVDGGGGDGIGTDGCSVVGDGGDHRRDYGSNFADRPLQQQQQQQRRRRRRHQYSQRVADDGTTTIRVDECGNEGDITGGWSGNGGGGAGGRAGGDGVVGSGRREMLRPSENDVDAGNRSFVNDGYEGKVRCGAVGEWGEGGLAEAGRGESGGRDLGDYVLRQKAVKGIPKSSEARSSYERAGRSTRLNGQDMLMPGTVQVEKVHTPGVHHPKFGLLFLNDGSLIVYVGTANLGTDTAIELTWVQRFNARRPCCNKQQHRPYVPAAAPGSGVMGAEDGKQLKSSRGGGQEGDGGKIDVLRPEVWEGDFGDTLQDFLEQESMLMECKLDANLAVADRRRLNTPVCFMRRVLGITRLRDSVDFSNATVDLIPTIPLPDPPHPREKPPSRTRPKTEQSRLPRAEDSPRSCRRQDKYPLSYCPSVAQQQQQQQHQQQQPHGSTARRPTSFPTLMRMANFGCDTGRSTKNSSTPVIWATTTMRDRVPAPMQQRKQPPLPPPREQHRSQTLRLPSSFRRALATHSDNAINNVRTPSDGNGDKDKDKDNDSGGNVTMRSTLRCQSTGVALAAPGRMATEKKDEGRSSSPPPPPPPHGGACCIDEGKSKNGGGTEADKTGQEEEKQMQRGKTLFKYGQLRMQYVLEKRCGEAGSLGPRDLLIIQPTSIGKGMDSKFMEVYARSLMPESVDHGSEVWANHDEQRLESSVRIVWPTRQYMEACRRDMAKSVNARDRQSATAMQVEHEYILGACNKVSSVEARCGFLFMGPEAYDEMGTDVHDCLYTFELHPAAGLPLRPTHVKSAMRLRPPPRFAPTTPSPSSLRVRNGAPRELGGSSEEGLGRFATVTAAGVMENGFDGDGRRGQGKRGSIDHGGGGGDGGGGGGTGGDDAVVGSGGAHRRSSSGPGGVPCEHAQHLAWFLLTSACLSKGAQGEITHARRSGRAIGIKCKNVELGVLFHSSKNRAFYTEPPQLCGCSCECTTTGGYASRPNYQRGELAGGTGPGSNRPVSLNESQHPVGRSPFFVPLPVPFRLDSEAYADRDKGTPHPRFPPFMHFLQEFPRSAEVEVLISSKIKEKQFA